MMGTKYYQKLVRDNIPDIIENNGERAIIRQLAESEFSQELNKKLMEETQEYLESGDVSELADIAEVIYAILDLRGIKRERFEELRLNKRNRNGGFENRVWLEGVVSGQE